MVVVGSELDKSLAGFKKWGLGAPGFVDDSVGFGLVQNIPFGICQFLVAAGGNQFVGGEYFFLRLAPGNLWLDAGGNQSGSSGAGGAWIGTSLKNVVADLQSAPFYRPIKNRPPQLENNGGRSAD